jgi:NAD(P)-dependent dehydrogenase (short-subunit alcohol dehydrogenase family)
MQKNGKVVLITGASGGFGRLMALLLASHDYTVFGTSRRATPGSTGIFTMLPLDVRDDASARACVEQVIARAGRIDVLINNAGYGFSGALEEANMEEVKALFETNFFGTVRMVNEVLPTMRRQRSGHIINISSVVGISGMPFEGFYAASKHAIEGYTESLRYEVLPFNIRVVLVEPGAFQTGFGAALQQASRTIADYQEVRQRAVPVFEEQVMQGADPILVARQVLHILQSRAPRLRYPVGNDAQTMQVMKRLLPGAAVEVMMRSLFKIDENAVAETAMGSFARWLRKR